MTNRIYSQLYLTDVFRTDQGMFLPASRPQCSRSGRLGFETCSERFTGVPPNDRKDAEG